MNCFEFEGKNLLARYGIPIPEGAMVYSPEDPAPIPFPLILKAQVLVGGRGKAGGVKVCRSQEDYDKHVRNIFALNIKGHPVNSLLAVKMDDAQQEWYLSITLQGVDRPTLIICPTGGVDIEEVAATQPEKILKLELDPFAGLKQYQLRRIVDHMGFGDELQLLDVVRNLYRAFNELGANLLEINPLGVVDGRIMALDAKVVLDDNNQRRIPDVFEEIAAGRAKMTGYKEPEKEATTITFVPLDGEIGLISDGAGTGMLTLDMVYDAGGSVASFAELGGITNADVMYRAMELTLQPGNKAKSLLIVLIGGFNRMDDMAQGIIRYLDAHKLSIPVYARMCGTMEEEGIAMMREAGYTTYSDLTDTVELSVKAAKGAM